MTLYTCASDKEPGKSACNGPGADNWPPFKPEANAPAPKASLSIIRRDDGSKQYAYKGKPLYYWKNDKKAGRSAGRRRGPRRSEDAVGEPLRAQPRRVSRPLVRVSPL
jgi:predicted lipoprotein with Yx(FWY)xxD motif